MRVGSVFAPRAGNDAAATATVAPPTASALHAVLGDGGVPPPAAAGANGGVEDAGYYSGYYSEEEPAGAPAAAAAAKAPSRTGSSVAGRSSVTSERSRGEPGVRVEATATANAPPRGLPPAGGSSAGGGAAWLHWAAEAAARAVAPPPVAAAAPAPPEEHEAAVRAMQAGAAAVKFAPEGTDGAAAVEGRLYLSDDRASLVFETHSRGVDVVVPLAEVEDVVYGQRTATYTAARRHATDDFRPGKGRALSNRGAPAPRTSKRATRAAPDLTPRSHPAAGPAALSFSLVRASATHDFCFTAADDACEAFVVGVARLVGAPLSRRDYCWRRTELKMMAAGAGSRSFADASRGLRAHADAERQRLAARTATAAAPPGLTAAQVPARSER